MVYNCWTRLLNPQKRIRSRSLISNFWVIGKMEMHGERRIRRSEGQDVEKFCEPLV